MCTDLLALDSLWPSIRGPHKLLVRIVDHDHLTLKSTFIQVAIQMRQARRDLATFSLREGIVQYELIDLQRSDSYR